MRAFLGSVSAGLAAFFLARGVGIEAWSWSDIGDAADIAFFVAGAYQLARPTHGRRE